MSPGYRSSEYAESFSDIGTPLRLPEAGGWLVKRKIPATDYYDAMGCYPFFSCDAWDGLADDVSRVAESIVSLTLVTDPSGAYAEELLRKCFPDVCYPFKKHFIVDLQDDWQQAVSKNHRRNAKKASKCVSVERIPEPAAYIDVWCRLYDILIERHSIRGIAAFSRGAFKRQLATPGVVAYRVVSQQDKTIGMVLWYIDGDIAYYHLGAYDEAGYDLRASFAVFWKAFEDFQDQGVRKMFLGAGAGLDPQSEDGLTRFKRGWATDTSTVYLCGKICQPYIYQELVDRTQTHEASYFPKYRAGEFG